MAYNELEIAIFIAAITFEAVAFYHYNFYEINIEEISKKFTTIDWYIILEHYKFCI